MKRERDPKKLYCVTIDFRCYAYCVKNGAGREWMSLRTAKALSKKHPGSDVLALIDAE
jgi:hypothetical protein